MHDDNRCCQVGADNRPHPTTLKEWPKEPGKKLRMSPTISVFPYHQMALFRPSTKNPTLVGVG